MTNSNKSVFIDRNTSHIKHGCQAKRMIMEYNACVSCALIGHNFPTVLQVVTLHTITNKNALIATVGYISVQRYCVIATCPSGLVVKRHWVIQTNAYRCTCMAPLCFALLNRKHGDNLIWGKCHVYGVSLFSFT